MADKKKIHVPDGYKLIFRRFKKKPNSNEVMDARRYGKKAWPLVVPA